MPPILNHAWRISVGVMVIALLAGCASAGRNNYGGPCPGTKVLMTVERTGASQPEHKCVYKEDVEYLFERPTEPMQRRRDPP